ncbi:AIPR family protein [Bacillus sp. SL00103]
MKGLSGWQIVNGGQTTASIHKAYKEGISLAMSMFR